MDAKAAYLDAAGNRRGRAGNHPTIDRARIGIIVADENGAAVDQPEREVRLARSRRSLDQDRAVADGDARCVQGFGVAIHNGALDCAQSAGNAMTKRAPLATGESATLIAPLCAVTIVFAIARPSPEWRAKSLAGRSL